VPVLLAAAAIGEIAGGDDQLRADPLYEPRQSPLDLRRLTCTRVEIGYMKEARGHNRMRL
jgi:hypothetical protein